MKPHRRLLLIAFLTVLPCAIAAQEVAQETAHEAADSVAKPRRDIVSRVIDYVFNANKPPSPDRRVDITFLGGPNYSGEKSLSLIAFGAALYRSVPADTLTPLSFSQLYVEGSVTGYYRFGIFGLHIGPDDRYRVDYDIEYSSLPTYFWGIGYANGRHGDDLRAKYRYLNFSGLATFYWRFAPNLYAGPTVDVGYGKASHPAESMVYLWEGQPLNVANVGAGLSLSYDSRDFAANPYRGIYVTLKQLFFPRFMGNGDYNFASTTFTFSHYFKAWRGAVIAWSVKADLTYGHTPWCMLPVVGGTHYGRGYYKGRYRDKDLLQGVVELRQHVWRRSSVVAWVGAAEVVPGLGHLRFSEILPNFGLGYRWEFKHRTNLRVDVGFGRGCHDFVFNLNEAF